VSCPLLPAMQYLGDITNFRGGVNIGGQQYYTSITYTTDDASNAIHIRGHVHVRQLYTVFGSKFRRFTSVITAHITILPTQQLWRCPERLYQSISQVIFTIPYGRRVMDIRIPKTSIVARRCGRKGVEVAARMGSKLCDYFQNKVCCKRRRSMESGNGSPRKRSTKLYR